MLNDDRIRVAMLIVRKTVEAMGEIELSPKQIAAVLRMTVYDLEHPYKPTPEEVEKDGSVLVVGDADVSARRSICDPRRCLADLVLARRIGAAHRQATGR
jgi:hypothetical protein